MKRSVYDTLYTTCRECGTTHPASISCPCQLQKYLEEKHLSNTKVAVISFTLGTLLTSAILIALLWGYL